MVQKLNNVAAGAVMDEQELDFVSGGSRAESKELVALIEMHWPGVYHKYTTTFGGIGSDCEKMLAHWGIKAKTGALDNNVYREATTGRFIRQEELCYWVKNGCKSDAKFKPWLNSDD